MKRSAIISDCGQYRYLLSREWPACHVGPLKRLCYIMLNPSTADAEEDDATIRVCVGRAKGLGYHVIDVVNLFALRSTSPSALYSHPSPVSEPSDGEPSEERNVQVIADTVAGADLIICAWGKHGAFMNRGPELIECLVGSAGMKLHAIKLNADGSPAHPLRLPYSQPLVEIA
jgi:hypothetical protein